MIICWSKVSLRRIREQFQFKKIMNLVDLVNLKIKFFEDKKEEIRKLVARHKIKKTKKIKKARFGGSNFL